MTDSRSLSVLDDPLLDTSGSVDDDSREARVAADELVRTQTPRSAAVSSPDPATEPAGVTKLHRAVTLLALIALFVNAHLSWTQVAWTSRPALVSIMTGYGLVLALGVATVCVRSSRSMLLVNVGVMVTTLLMRLPTFLTSLHPGSLSSYYPNDEGPLVDNAGAALAHGLNPYTQVWANAHSFRQPGVTLLMNGGVVDHFDYPPLSAILNALAHPFTQGMPTAAIVSTGALIVAMVVMFTVLPGPWRAAAPLLIFGFDLLPSIARNGYPSMIAVPLLIGAVAGWTRIGSTGRLGWRGIVSATCLGLAICAHPLPWFAAPFLVVGLFGIRLADGPRRAVRVVGGYLAVVLIVVAALNVPFIVASPHAWFAGVLLPMSAPTMPHGQGLIDITFYLVGGSGAIRYFNYATMFVFLGALTCYAVFLRRLGPAAVILPWVMFFVGVRSQDIYYLSMTPVWIVSLATVRPADFAAAVQLRPAWRWFRPFDHWVGRVALMLALLAPVVFCVTTAIRTPQPLRMNVIGLLVDKKNYLLNTIEVNVTNEGQRAVEPHFLLSNNYSISRFWNIDTGPARLQPGQAALYVLVPPTNAQRRSLNDRVLLRAVSDNPTTLSSVQISGPGQSSPSGGKTVARYAP